MSGEIQFVSPYMAASHLIALGVLDSACAAALEAARAGDEEAKIRLTDSLKYIQEKTKRSFEPPIIDDYTKIEGVDAKRIAEAGRRPLKSSVRFFTTYTEILTPKKLDTGLVGELVDLALNEGGEVASEDDKAEEITEKHHLGRVIGNLLSYMGGDARSSFLKLYAVCVRELMPIMKNPVAARAHAGILLYYAADTSEIEGANAKAISRYAAEILPDVQSKILMAGDDTTELYHDAYSRIRNRVDEDVAHEIALNSAIFMSEMFVPVEGAYEQWVELTTDTYLVLQDMLSKTEIKDVAKEVALIAALDEYSDLASARKKAIQYRDAVIAIRNVVKSMGVVGKAASDIALESFAGTTGLEDAKKYARTAAKEYLRKK